MGKVESTVVVDAPVRECYALWTDFENFPRFMDNVESVHKGPGNSWVWTIKGPLGEPVVWYSHAHFDPYKTVSWHTIPSPVSDLQHPMGESDALNEPAVENAGIVIFEPLSDTQTRVFLSLDYSVIGGSVGEFVAEKVQKPQEKIDEDLQRFKRLAEHKAVHHPGSLER